MHGRGRAPGSAEPCRRETPRGAAALSTPPSDVRSLIQRRGPWRHCEAVEFATLAWVDWFNTRRLLEPLGYVPPAEYEAQYDQQRERGALAGIRIPASRMTGGPPSACSTCCHRQYTLNGLPHQGQTHTSCPPTNPGP